MDPSDKIALAKAIIEKAEADLKTALQVLGGENVEIPPAPLKKTKKTKPSKSDSTADTEDVKNIIEGEFDGQHMIGPDGKTYPVPANYASKSKLVPGDRLKLTIQDDGSFIYKQIGPTERIHVIGPLTYENGQYQVLANGQSYKVLLASVTYYKAQVGDKIGLIIPKNKESEWGAIDHVLPKEVEIESNPPEDDLF